MKNYTITVNGNQYNVSVQEGAYVQTPQMAAPVAQPAPVQAPVSQAQAAPAAPVAATTAPVVTAGSQGSVKVNAPMPGKIVAIKVSAGQAVKRGDVILILEAMKMENEIVAPEDGTVASINTTVGANIESGFVLATLN